MKSEYELTAEKFLRDNKISFKQETIWDHAGCPWDKEHPYYHLLHKCVFRNRTTGKSMTVNFWGSIKEYQEGNDTVHPYDVLSCLQKYEIGTIDDFVSEFGYTVDCWEDVKRIQSTYNAVKKEYKNVCRVFNNCLDSLREIG